MRKKTKILLGLSIFVLLAVVIGLSVGLTVGKKSSTQDTKDIRSDGLKKFNDEYEKNYAYESETGNKIAQGDSDLHKLKYFTKSTPPISIDSYYSFYNDMEQKINLQIRNVNNIYNFMGNYDNAGKTFSYTKKKYQTEGFINLLTDINEAHRISSNRKKQPVDDLENILNAIDKLRSTIASLRTYITSAKSELE